MKKLASFIISALMGVMVTVMAFPSQTYAATCEKTFLGLRPWYMGLTETKKDANNNDTCVIKEPGGSGDEMSKFVWQIVLNLSVDLSLLVGYVAIIFVIYGGFKYIMSTGEPPKVAQAKTIITNALIGLVIAILATVIVNTILIVVGSSAQ